MTELSENVLDLNYEKEANHICNFIRNTLHTKLKCRGLVMAISSGIDGTCSAALTMRALGKDKVFCLRLPGQGEFYFRLTLIKKWVMHCGLIKSQLTKYRNFLV